MKNRYLEISNIGVITTPALELLGYSNKRNRSDLIGEKGTGLKFSRLQCLRKGIDCYVSTDQFINSYQTKKIDDENDQVLFQYKFKNKKSVIKESSYTVKAGFGDWVEDWFILREVLQNAIDETIRSEYIIDRYKAIQFILKCIRIVNKVEYAKKRNTNVYISLTPEIEKIATKLNDYFCNEPVFSCEYGALHTKRNNKMRVYKQGIYIQDYSRGSLYDYEFSAINLTESRMIKYDGDISEHAFKIYSEAPLKIKREFLRYCNYNDSAAELIMSYSFTTGYLFNIDQWAEAFISEFGERAVIHNKNTISDVLREKVEMHKYKIIVLINPLYSFLKNKIQTLEELTSSYDELQYHQIEPDIKIKEYIDQAKDILYSIFPKIPEIKVFEPITNLEINTAGVYLPRKNIILLNQKQCTGLNHVLETLIEELIHYETQAEDMSRAFQNFAITKIKELLLK